MSESVQPNIDNKSPADAAADGSPSATERRRVRVRLWPAWALILLTAGMVGVLFRIAADDPIWQAIVVYSGSFLLGVLLVLWWLTFSATPWKTRVFTFLIFIAGIVAVCFGADQSFRMYVVMAGGTVFIVSSVVWLTLTAWSSWPVRSAGVVLVALICAGISLSLSTEGSWGNMAPDNVTWRWAATAEQRAVAYFHQNKRHQSVIVNQGEPLQAAEGEWTQFRGPSRAGAVTGANLSRTWSVNEPKEIWRHPVGPGWSSFAAVGGYLFTQEQRLEKELVVCYDAATGKQIWTHAVNERFSEDLGGDGPRATPTFFAGKIYALGATGVLLCLDARTGAKSWSRNILEDAGAKNLQWGMAGSPLVYDNLVVVNPGGESGKALIAYDSKSGKISWHAGNFKAGYSSPQLSTVVGQRQILVFHPKGVTGHDPKSGNELWRYQWETDGQNNSIQPRVLDDGTVLVSAVFFGTQCFTVSNNDGKWTTKQKWKTGRLKLYYNDMVTKDGHIYALDRGRLSCYDLANGKRIWKDGDYGSGQLLLVDDLLIVQGERGDVALVEASPAGLKELGRFQALEGKTWNHPVLVGNRLYVRNSREAACYEVPLAEQPQPGNKAPDK